MSLEGFEDVKNLNAYFKFQLCIVGSDACNILLLH